MRHYVTKSTNPKVLERAVLAIAAEQEADEQASEQTVHRNGRGFNQEDAPTGTRVARLLRRGLRLADLPEYMNWAKSEMPKYAGQLAAIANRRSEPRPEPDSEPNQQF
jgi:hypothetical protein